MSDRQCHLPHSSDLRGTVVALSPIDSAYSVGSFWVFEGQIVQDNDCGSGVLLIIELCGSVEDLQVCRGPTHDYKVVCVRNSHGLIGYLG